MHPLWEPRVGQNDTLDPAGQDRFKTRTGNHRNLEETSSTCEKPLNEDDRHETAHMAITIVVFLSITMRGRIVDLSSWPAEKRWSESQ